nr:hypothetical protein [Planomicrobium stackebrandtii]
MEMSDTDKAAFLLYIDERWPANSQDGNKVSIYLISDFDLSDSSYEDVISFNNDLLGMKYNCSYVMDILRVKEEFDFNFPYDMLAISTYVQTLLTKLHSAKELPALKENDFNYLSQQMSAR